MSAMYLICQSRKWRSKWTTGRRWCWLPSPRMCNIRDQSGPAMS